MPATNRFTRVGAGRPPKLTYDNRICALNDAVSFLEAQESESDEPGDREAREALAARLDKEADRLKLKRDARL